MTRCARPRIPPEEWIVGRTGRRAALLIVLLAARPASAQTPPEWPDAGSEDPDGRKLFEKSPVEEAYDEDRELSPELEQKLEAKTVLRWSWYGWRNLIADGAAALIGIGGLVGWGLSDGSPEGVGVMIAGAGLYVFGGPIAHLTKGNWGRSLISLGMRIGGPTLGGLAGFGLCSIGDCDEVAAVLTGFVSVFLGVVVPAGLDAGLVAREKVEVRPAISAVPNGPRTLGLSVAY